MSMRTRNARRVIVKGGQNLTISEAANKLEISAPACQAMYGKGIETYADMVQYRKDLKRKGGRHGGSPAKKYTTTKGVMSIAEMARAHEHGLVAGSIRYRAWVWGWDHKCLWLPKMGPKKFSVCAIELDGPPRGQGRNDRSTNPNDKKVTKKTVTTGVNRLRACLRDKGREKCIHYNDRIACDRPKPKECAVACGDYCSNYCGATVKVQLDCSGRPPRKYNINGTATSYA